LQQMWERACPRSAARAALDLKGAKDLKASASRCAAQAALDLLNNAHPTPCTKNPYNFCPSPASKQR